MGGLELLIVACPLCSDSIAAAAALVGLTGRQNWGSWIERLLFVKGTKGFGFAKFERLKTRNSFEERNDEFTLEHILISSVTIDFDSMIQFEFIGPGSGLESQPYWLFIFIFIFGLFIFGSNFVLYRNGHFNPHAHFDLLQFGPAGLNLHSIYG